MLFRVNVQIFNWVISMNREVRLLTVWIFGEDLVRDFGWIADANGVDGTNSDDVLLLWFDSIVDPEVELFDGSVVDPEPFQFRTGLCHLHVVTGDRAAAVLHWRLPGNVDVHPAGVGHSHLERRRWSTWREENIGSHIWNVSTAIY